ncbi:integrase [Gossypium australe]|uniref:Integrase n=1 Tax=Gossypium australe TaxID=47621 RepID=A0A5B6VYC4_9ROSI|nr:integrase [Gossypium australe]
MFARLSLFDDGSMLVELKVKPTWVDQIRAKQLDDGSLVQRLRQVESGEASEFDLNSDRVLFVCLRTVNYDNQSCRKHIATLTLCNLVGIKCTVIYDNCTGGLVKVEHQFPSRLLQLVKIPWWKWEHVTMDFISGLPLTPTKKDSIWVTVDPLTKSAHSFPIGIHNSPPDSRKNYSDGQSERVIQILEDMLTSCVINFRSSIQMTPYEALYSHKCRTLLCWTKLGDGFWFLILNGRSCVPESIAMEKDPLIWTKGQVKFKIHRTLPYSETGWTGCLLA